MYGISFSNPFAEKNSNIISILEYGIMQPGLALACVESGRLYVGVTESDFFLTEAITDLVGLIMDSIDNTYVLSWTDLTVNAIKLAKREKEKEKKDQEKKDKEKKDKEKKEKEKKDKEKKDKEKKGKEKKEKKQVSSDGEKELEESEGYGEGKGEREEVNLEESSNASDSGDEPLQKKQKH